MRLFIACRLHRKRRSVWRRRRRRRRERHRWRHWRLWGGWEGGWGLRPWRRSWRLRRGRRGRRCGWSGRRCGPSVGGLRDFFPGAGAEAHGLEDAARVARARAPGTHVLRGDVAEGAAARGRAVEVVGGRGRGVWIGGRRALDLGIVLHRLAGADGGGQLPGLAVQIVARVHRKIAAVHRRLQVGKVTSEAAFAKAGRRRPAVVELAADAGATRKEEQEGEGSAEHLRSGRVRWGERETRGAQSGATGRQATQCSCRVVLAGKEGAGPDRDGDVAE